MGSGITGEADTRTMLLDRLQAARRGGRLDRIEIEYWTGGGPPPPHYRSDQFRLMAVEAQLVMEFARPVAGGKLTEKFRRLARTEEVRALTGMIDALGVFWTQFDEEARPDGSDLLSTEILLRDGETALKRIYWRRVPRALDPIRLQVGAWTAELIAAGEHGLFDRGQPVSVDRPGAAILLGIPLPSSSLEQDDV